MTRSWLEIDTRALEHNLRVFRSVLARSTRSARSGRLPLLMAIVKSNAYGHGLVECARILSGRTATGGTTANGADWLGVDDLDEALILRKAQIKLPILVLGYTLPNRFGEAVENNVSLTAASVESLAAMVNRKWQRANLKVHIKLETGLNRQGITLEELETGCQMLEKLKGETILEGVYSHFAAAELALIPKYKKYCELQMDRFEKMILQLQASGLQPPVLHMAGTAATILLPRSRYDLVRVGIGMYGLDPTSDVSRPLVSGFRGPCPTSRRGSSGVEVRPLRPALFWYSIIAQIKTVKNGERVGYNLTEKLTRDSKLAVVPVGYWHGLPRSLSGRGYVLVKNKRCKIVGRISMDMMTIDVTDAPKVKVGNCVTLIGKGLSAEEVATKASTINYELVTCINPLLSRMYK